MLAKHAYYILFVMVWACSACRTEGPSVAVTNPEVSLPYNTVLVLDKTTTDWTAGVPWERQSKIAIDRNVKSVGPTGLLRVNISVRNRTDHPVRLDIQTRYFDSDDEELDATSTETMVLRAQETKPYGSSSLREDVSKYRVIIAGAR